MTPIQPPAPGVKPGRKGSGNLGQTLGALGGAAIGAGIIATAPETAPLAPTLMSALGATGGGAGLGSLLDSTTGARATNAQAMGGTPGVPLMQSSAAHQDVLGAFAALPFTSPEVNRAATPYLAQAILMSQKQGGMA
jgi:hypothetical protein